MIYMVLYKVEYEYKGYGLYKIKDKAFTHHHHI